jgi:hypothetical protein
MALITAAGAGVVPPSPRERLREGAPCRFAIDEASSVPAPPVARVVLAE